MAALPSFRHDNRCPRRAALEVIKLSARPQLENVLARYAWTFDMDELDQIGDCFSEDAEVLFAAGLRMGREAVVEQLEHLRQRYRAEGVIPWHVITNLYIRDESPEEVAATSFWTVFGRPPSGAATLGGTGYYEDVFAREGEAWRIRRRRVLRAGER